MRPITIGVVDYGIGNHASVIHSLRELNYRVRVSSDAKILDATDILILPGVGAFPTAIHALHRRDFVEYLREKARAQHPIVGICLGMQLLTSASHEHGYTAGLDIIPGEIMPLNGAKWHIGWNTMECINQDGLFIPSDGQAFYFNHSFSYQGPEEYQVAISRNPGQLVAAIRRGRVVGLQFHPEKSQSAGRVLLSNVITGLCRA